MEKFLEVILSNQSDRYLYMLIRLEL